MVQVAFEEEVTDPENETPSEIVEQDGPREQTADDNTIRVNVDHLENLMILVSELVLTRNQLLQMIRGHDDSEFKLPLQRLSLITTDLQDGVMKTRMQPIGNAWTDLPGMVCDLTAGFGKEADLQMTGAETELDRQILEQIKNPLAQIIRNSLEHGLEKPEQRLKTGKTETGAIKLNAFHEGGHIIVEISDDGGGIDTEKIKEKCIEIGLVSESELESLSGNQINQFIFKDNITTAEDTSGKGRGGGLFGVHESIERIGGTIELNSTPGEATTIIIKIPLTLAIVSALIVEAGGERFAIPQISVLELVRASNNSESNIEMINESPVLRLRDHLLPLISLNLLLRLEKKENTATSDNNDAVNNIDDEHFIVVCQTGTFKFGVIVEKVFDNEEIVVKPVAPLLRDIAMFSGNTILGDGSVIMILDPNGIAASIGDVMRAQEHTDSTDVEIVSGDTERTSLLVFRAGGDELKAVSLALVARLEDIELAKVEYSHGAAVVQYRGHLMPLIVMDGCEMKNEGRQPVLVFSDREKSMGLVVDEILDIVDDQMKIELGSDQQGLIGTAIIDGKATDIIDVGYYLTQAFCDWFGRPGHDSFDASSDGHRLLLVDDSAFFRNLMKPMLSVAGYDVITVEDAEEALSLREAGERFDIIVSDIEMPEMNGFDFATAVHEDPRWKDTPMVALTAHASDKDCERGLEAGFDGYVSKFDRDALMHTIGQAMKTASVSNGGDA